MFKLIYMKADYEPWWQFEGWESYIEQEQIFETEEALEAALQERLTYFRVRYMNEQQRDAKFFAFWSDDECEYCEACEDDVQVFHGLIIEKPAYLAIDRK